MSDAEEHNEISSVVKKRFLEYINKIYHTEKHEYFIEGAAKKGDNYMGVVYRITIKSRYRDDLKIILKVPPQNLHRRQQFFARPGFLREAQAFEKFLPLTYEFQKKRGLSEMEMFHEYPTSLFTLTDDMFEAICMNDLQVEGFYMHNRFKPISQNHVALLMRIYGKLHATTLVIKDQEPEKLNDLRKIEDLFFQRKDDEQLNDYFESLKICALGSLDTDTDRYQQRLIAYFNKGTLSNLMLGILDSASSEPYSVICHGDCWINNIMFKNEDDNIVDARLIDWQIMRYASPIVDLMYFLMSSTTRDFRKSHFNDMIKIYHNAAKDHIKRLGCDPEKLYPRKGFDKEFKEKGAIGLLFAMIVLPVMTTKSEDVPDLEELSEKVQGGESTDAQGAGFSGVNSSLYNQRMSEIIMDCVDWGLI